MRANPDDGDELFQVKFLVTAPVDRHPTGPRYTATFAKNWMEACHMVRTQYGAENADRVEITQVFQHVHNARGQKIDDIFFYDRFKVAA